MHRGKSQRHIVIPDTDLTQCSCVCARRIVFRFPTFPSHVFDFTSAFNRPRMLLIFLPYIRRSYLRYFFPFPLFADFIWKERARSPSIPLVFLYSIHEFIWRLYSYGCSNYCFPIRFQRFSTAIRRDLFQPAFWNQPRRSVFPDLVNFNFLTIRYWKL